jgi:hypothetical protein
MDTTGCYENYANDYWRNRAEWFVTAFIVKKRYRDENEEFKVW